LSSSCVWSSFGYGEYHGVGLGLGFRRGLGMVSKKLAEEFGYILIGRSWKGILLGTAIKA
jgi:hypothetical protein